jgi:hypothetical protein
MLPMNKCFGLHDGERLQQKTSAAVVPKKRFNALITTRSNLNTPDSTRNEWRTRLYGNVGQLQKQRDE